jgi:hypothetical protein
MGTVHAVSADGYYAKVVLDGASSFTTVPVMNLDLHEAERAADDREHRRSHLCERCVTVRSDTRFREDRGSRGQQCCTDCVPLSAWERLGIKSSASGESAEGAVEAVIEERDRLRRENVDLAEAMTPSSLAPKLARALFEEGVMTEALRISERDNAALLGPTKLGLKPPAQVRNLQKVLDIMWDRTKPDVRRECEQLAKGVARRIR